MIVKVLDFIAWLLSGFKVLRFKIYKFTFKLIKVAILVTEHKNIEEILRLPEWQNARSVLFFFTGIIVENKWEKDYPVKRFKIKWYLWVFHYIWALWIFFKLFIYWSLFTLCKILKKDLWVFLWLMLLEYWRWRLLWMKEGFLYLEIALEWYFAAYIFFLDIPEMYANGLIVFKKVIRYEKTVMPIYFAFLKYNWWNKLLIFLGY